MTFAEIENAAEIYKEIAPLAEWYEFTPEVMDAITNFALYAKERQDRETFQNSIAASIRRAIEQEWESRDKPEQVELIFRPALGFFDIITSPAKYYLREQIEHKGGATLRITGRDSAEFEITPAPAPSGAEVGENDGTLLGTIFGAIRADAPEHVKNDLRMFRDVRRVE